MKHEHEFDSNLYFGGRDKSSQSKGLSKVSQCEALARLPELPCVLIFLFLPLGLHPPASARVYWRATRAR